MDIHIDNRTFSFSHIPMHTEDGKTLIKTYYTNIILSQREHPSFEDAKCKLASKYTPKIPDCEDVDPTFENIKSVITVSRYFEVGSHPQRVVYASQKLSFHDGTWVCVVNQQVVLFASQH